MAAVSFTRSLESEGKISENSGFSSSSTVLDAFELIQEAKRKANEAAKNCGRFMVLIVFEIRCALMQAQPSFHKTILERSFLAKSINCFYNLYSLITKPLYN